MRKNAGPAAPQAPPGPALGSPILPPCACLGSPLYVGAPRKWGTGLQAHARTGILSLAHTAGRQTSSPALHFIYLPAGVTQTRCPGASGCAQSSAAQTECLMQHLKQCKYQSRGH